MDPVEMLMVMIFALVFIIVTGMFAIALPMARQLAKYFEQRMKDKAAGATSSNLEAEIRQLRVLVQGLDERMRGLSDRHEFLEKLLETRDKDASRKLLQ